MQAMKRSIGDYRLLLRRYLGQVERMSRLQKLRLKESDTYRSELNLYNTGHAIVDDMEKNMTAAVTGYYSYSGIQQFCQYLKEYMGNYHVEEGRVVHRGQRASRALLLAIQMAALPVGSLTEEVRHKLIECNKAVVAFGSREQCELHQQTLSSQKTKNSVFFTGIIENFESLMAERFSEAA